MLFRLCVIAIVNIAIVNVVLLFYYAGSKQWAAREAFNLIEESQKMGKRTETLDASRIGKDDFNKEGTDTRHRHGRHLSKNKNQNKKLQPRVTIVETLPSRKGFSSLSNPEGTIWCGGAPTYWIVGHQHSDESPTCFVNGKWIRSATVQMDITDDLNGNVGIDRHACATMDVNRDGRPDIICGVGADEGKGEGYNELYITQENGTIVKLKGAAGLQKYPSMSNRFVSILKTGPGKEEFVFFATIHGERDDGKPNEARMFRNSFSNETNRTTFVEVPGPWTTLLMEASCAVAGDFTGDERDDLIVCNLHGTPLLVRQEPNGYFTRLKIRKRAGKGLLQGWRNVRIADVTLDGIPDLVVVTNDQPSWLYIFQGMDHYPYFNFKKTYYQLQLKWASPNVEVLDVNNDNVPDLYVVQADETPRKYCGRGNAARFWGGTTQPPSNYIPPRDAAKDMLLIGTGDASKPYDKIKMRHAMPGCGFIAQRWDTKTMMLGQGTWDAAGYGLLLQW